MSFVVPLCLLMIDFLSYCFPGNTFIYPLFLKNILLGNEFQVSNLFFIVLYFPLAG